MTRAPRAQGFSNAPDSDGRGAHTGHLVMIYYYLVMKLRMNEARALAFRFRRALEGGTTFSHWGAEQGPWCRHVQRKPGVERILALAA